MKYLLLLLLIAYNLATMAQEDSIKFKHKSIFASAQFALFPKLIDVSESEDQEKSDFKTPLGYSINLGFQKRLSKHCGYEVIVNYAETNHTFTYLSLANNNVTKEPVQYNLSHRLYFIFANWIWFSQVSRKISLQAKIGLTPTYRNLRLSRFGNSQGTGIHLPGTSTAWVYLPIETGLLVNIQLYKALNVFVDVNYFDSLGKNRQTVFERELGLTHSNLLTFGLGVQWLFNQEL